MIRRISVMGCHHAGGRGRPAIAMVVGGLLLLAGCLQAPTEEAEHHAPPHKPRDFAAAVDRLLELDQEIAAGSTRSTRDLDVFRESREVSQWLPELAADSDLAEPEWNQVAETSRQLTQLLMSVEQAGPTERTAAYRGLGDQLDPLHVRLVQIQQTYLTLHPPRTES